MTAEADNGNNAAVAFGLVIAAGAATAIGSALVFFPSLVKLANRRVLAASLGVATGVMLYVSLVDIYNKSVTGFVESGHDDGKAFIYTTLTFFGGIFLMMFVNEIVVGYCIMKKCAGGGDLHSLQHDFLEPEKAKDAASKPSLQFNTTGTTSNGEVAVEEEAEGHNCFRPVAAEQYENVQYIADKVQTKQQLQQTTEKALDEEATTDPESEEEDKLSESSIDESKLMHMGISTAIAIALHNFPEGLVTFVAYMADPTVGIVLCIGIALHNIPEGVVVSMPIYYATGNRLRAFLWGSLSGVSEPLGALIGWAVLASSGFSGNMYGILFGLVSGIMTYITLDEILPTALSYDPKNSLVTYSVIGGMLIIAASLMIFSV